MANKWRISGGIGVPPEDPHAQNMTQGLGFPLRPVDNVPSTNSDIYDGIEVAEGLFLQWCGTYQAGLLYPRGAVVNDGPWAMIANIPTVTKPAPVPEGDRAWALPLTPAFVEQNDHSVVYSGHTYEFLESGWVNGLRVWVSELSVDTNYRVVILDVTDPNRLSTVFLQEPVLTEDAWHIVAFSDQLVAAGQKFLVYIDAWNNGGSTSVTGGWTYRGSSGNALTPADSSWTKDNQNTVLNIHRFDLDSTDRVTELEGFIPGTDIQLSQTQDPNRSMSFRVVRSLTDFGTYFQYPVSLISTGPGGTPETGEATTMTAIVPVAQDTKYVQAPGTPTPTWATVTPHLEYDGVGQFPGDVAFGVDINFQLARFSPSWDILAITQV